MAGTGSVATSLDFGRGNEQPWLAGRCGSVAREYKILPSNCNWIRHEVLCRLRDSIGLFCGGQSEYSQGWMDDWRINTRVGWWYSAPSLRQAYRPIREDVAAP